MAVSRPSQLDQRTASVSQVAAGPNTDVEETTRSRALPSLRPVSHSSPVAITRRPTLPQTQQPSTVHHASNDQVKVLSREPVDGGWRAWSVLVGSTAFMIPTFGLMTTVGIFQVYWKENQLAPWSNTDISWIISIFGFLSVLLCGPFGILFDTFGPRWLVTPATIVYSAAFLGVAFSSQYWQFMVCFCAAGISAAALTTTALAVINHWFDDKKGLAMGICTMGGGLGGVIFSVVLRFTTKNFEWTTASLIHFAIICAFLSLGCALTRPRVLKARKGKMWDFACFRRWKFVLFTFSVCGFELVLFVAWGLLPTYARIVKLGDVFYLILVFSVGSSFGRIVPGYFTDKIGPFNVTILMTIFTEAVMLVLWLAFGDTSAPTLYAVAFCLGFGTGSFVSTAATCLGRLCDPQDSGTYIGCCYAVTGSLGYPGEALFQRGWLTTALTIWLKERLMQPSSKMTCRIGPKVAGR
ncbi:uncharacterized protein CLUP02_05906 [Colletotrichum lupini]|uniref:Major facilitator superfamily (MFS) profile domain-containing protein n=1 Tax=Colletotrichum lupini TaxID=145971 RepID=A0A9Q8WE60_9PEZI|nr:uncharacterized protein CLUP02_05906 [Colletotrichum lupini]UQC80423.1 hypothetical protein CLUP02_05906 [Colletotrichum lupini]